jgi:outer membrane protein TolC
MTITLDEALDRAIGTSERVAIARGDAERARGGERRASSGFLPQLSGAASYDRTLASEFDGLFDTAGSTPPCDPLLVNPAAPLEDRVAELERAYGCEPSGGIFGGGDVDLPFGQANAWRVNLQVSQALFTGGRLTAQREQARAQRDNAELGVTTAQAQAMLDVGQAFLDAALSDRLLAIAQSSYEQADRAYRQTLAQRQVGRQSEFDLLRAQVDRDTLQPEIVARQAARRLAYLRLKQLLEIPLDTELQAVIELVEGELLPPATLARAIADAEAGNIPGPRVALSQAQNEVRVRDEGVRIARSQRLPSVYLQSAYGLVNYSGAPAFDDYRDNWTVGATVAVPLFTGGRLRADEQIARADADQARQQLRLAKEVADLDRESAREQLVSARAAWDATAGTVRQAQRAYEIAELRYKEGLSTQLELSDARLLLEQTQLNRATAGRALQLARIRVALLPDLPLGTASSAQLGASGSTMPAAVRVTGGTAASGTPSAGVTR